MRTLSIAAVCALAAGALAGPTPPLAPDVPAKFDLPARAADYERRELMIPMRDGVKLKTFLVVPHNAKRAPIILTRTPYNASKRAERAPSTLFEGAVPVGYDMLAAGGYILAFQDIRGKYGSEGDYVMTRPLRGPLNDSKVDHSTDTYDTIEYLVKNVPETNGKVGMIGSSYEGFTVLMALVKPHPALKAAVPMCPMVDGWRGDDWFHNGAFRQINFDYFVGQTSARGEGKAVARAYDDYETFRRAGSAGDYAKKLGVDQLPYWHKVSEHPAYDAYWQHQALDKILAKEPLAVPTLIVTSIWDQEDIYGGMATYAAIEPKDKGNDKVFLALGPWRHSGINHSDSRTLGPLDFGYDTAAAFRRDVLRPFFDARLKDAAPAWAPPPVSAYETGTGVWRKLASWPPPSTKQKLYVGPGGVAGFQTPAGAGDEFDEYISDPGKPVPYLPRPVRFADSDRWRAWLLSDQRAVADRPDVLVYQTEALTAPVKIAGPPQVHLFASTTGTDADWVVKLIDVYPDEVAAQPHLGGYQLGVAMDIFRGRYRASLEHPSAIPANQVQSYAFALPNVQHVFLPGHRIMVQIQSSWFPLYDRNPQTFVPNIFFAAPADYKKATHRVYRRGANATFIELPVVK